MHLKNFLFFNCFFITTLPLFSQGLINNGAHITLNNGGAVYIDGGTSGDFINQDAAGPSYGRITIITDGYMYLEGDWTNNSADPTNKVFTTTSLGEIYFSGANAQSIGGTSSTNFPTLGTQNTSGIANGITLNIPTFVFTQLKLSDGVINTSSSNYLRLEDGAISGTGANTSYVDGPLRYAMALSGSRSLSLPLGKGNDWRPVILTPTHGAATEYYYTAELFNADAQALGFIKPPTITHVSYVHYYTITRNSTNNFTNATLRIYYSNTDGYNDGVTDAANLGVAKDDGSGNWVDITSGGGSANNVGNILSASYSPQNTYFVLANRNGGTNPLPITLLDFSGECYNEKYKKIKWTTTSETNNDFFTIEATTNPSGSWSLIGTIDGAGNSTTTTNYEFIDTLSLHSTIHTIYYRLKQTDFDGTTTTFPSITVTCKNFNPGISFYLFPNPSDGMINLFFSGMKNEQTIITISDVLGRELLTKTLLVKDDLYVEKINLQNEIPAGTYFVTSANNQYQFTQKLIIH